MNLLQNFQNGFIRSALKLTDSLPKALLSWDIGLMPMKWRIAQKKLLFLNQLRKRDISHLANQVVYEVQKGLPMNVAKYVMKLDSSI